MKACFQGFVTETSFSRGYQQCALRRVPLNAPRAIAFVKHGVVGEIGNSKRAFQFHTQRSVDGAAAFKMYLSGWRVSNSGERDMPARSDDSTHRHLVPRKRAGFV